MMGNIRGDELFGLTAAFAKGAKALNVKMRDIKTSGNQIEDFISALPDWTGDNPSLNSKLKENYLANLNRWDESIRTAQNKDVTILFQYAIMIASTRLKYLIKTASSFGKIEGKMQLDIGTGTIIIPTEEHLDISYRNGHRLLWRREGPIKIPFIYCYHAGQNLEKVGVLTQKPEDSIDIYVADKAQEVWNWQLDPLERKALKEIGQSSLEFNTKYEFRYNKRMKSGSYFSIEKVK